MNVQQSFSCLCRKGLGSVSPTPTTAGAPQGNAVRSLEWEEAAAGARLIAASTMTTCIAVMSRRATANRWKMRLISCMILDNLIVEGQSTVSCSQAPCRETGAFAAIGRSWVRVRFSRLKKSILAFAALCCSGELRPLD
ncbi:MAG: hypothetical protein ACR652_17905 [Methylocystis sp.]|uniref:hypothetical protein n=1 Tax=Methylocystis sp. TaxID=1911079 RepID=UPI003DA65648